MTTNRRILDELSEISEAVRALQLLLPSEDLLVGGELWKIGAAANQLWDKYAKDTPPITG